MLRHVAQCSLITATNESLGVEDGIFGVHRCLVLSSITNQTLLSRESDV